MRNASSRSWNDLQTKMKRRTLLLCAATLLAIVSGSSCKSAFELLLDSNDTDAKYDAAFDFFNQGKYNKASQLFESISVVTNGTDREDTVQYYWGLSNYRFKDYYTAETNFQSFITKFPRSPFTEQASFLRVDCLYKQTLRYELDQKPTTAALAAVGEFLTNYPSTPQLDYCTHMIDDLSERLDRKAYENAKLYYRMEDYLAANTALKNVLKDNSDNRYREDILYYTAMSAYKYAHLSVPEKQKERYLSFVDEYYNFIGEYPESSYRRELDVMFRRSQRALGRNVSDDDEELDKNDKDFEKERRRQKDARG